MLLKSITYYVELSTVLTHGMKCRVVDTLNDTPPPLPNNKNQYPHYIKVQHSRDKKRKFNATKYAYIA